MPLESKCPTCGYALAGLASARCPECGVDVTPALIEQARRRAHRRRWLIALAVIAFSMYAPFSWLLWMDYPWSDDYRWLWLRMWPILPGLPVTILLRVFSQWRGPEWLEMVCMGVFTALALLLFTWLGARGRWWLIITTIIVLALSCYNGWIGYVLFQL